MIRDVTIDQTLIELARTMKALKALRAARQTGDRRCINSSCVAAWRRMSHACGDECPHCDSKMTLYMDPVAQHAAATRASMDLTRKLADLRQGR
jgi:hypothetical protein